MKTTLLALLLFVPADILSGQCSVISRWGERGITRDFVVDGSTVVAADGRGVAVYDTANPAAIRQTGTLRTDGVALAIEPTAGGYAVLTSRGLELFRLAGGRPERYWSGEPHKATHLSCEGTLCATAGATLEIFRAAGGTLERVSSAALAFPADSLLVKGSRIYVGAGRLTTSVFTSGGDRIAELPMAALDFAASGSRVFAASGGAGLTVIEDSPTPEIIARHFVAEMDLRRVDATGSHILVWDAQAGEILKIDLSVISAPSIIARTAESPDALRAGGEHLYTAFAARGLRLRNLSDLSLVADFEQAEGPLSGVATDGAYGYVADPPLFRVIDLRDPLHPREVAAIPLDDSADRVRIQGSMAIVYGRANVHLIDISQPERPRYLGVYRSLGTIPNAAAFAGHLLIEDNKASGFHVLDISNPANPVQIGGLKNDFYGQFYGVAARPGAAYGFAQRALKVIDLSDPVNPRVDHVIATLNIIDAEIAPATASHPELLLLADAHRIRIFDITQPMQPVETGQIEIDGMIELAAAADVAYVSTSGGEIHRIELANGPPRVTHTATGFYFPTQISISPDQQNVAVADGYSLLLLHDLAGAQRSLDAPILNLAIQSGRVARLSWSGVSGVLFEVQTSADPGFTAPESTMLSGRTAEVPVAQPLFARVRATTGCTASNWSNVVAINAGAPSLAFATAGQRIVTAGSGTIEFDVVVVNYGASAVVPGFEHSTETTGLTITTPPARQVNAGESALFRFAVSPPPPGSTTTVRILIAGSDAVHTVAISRVAPAQLPRPAGDALVLAGVAATPGNNDTIWKTDLNLLCRSTVACPLQVTFNRFGTLDPAQSVQFNLAAGEGIVVRNAVVELFGASPAFGAFEIRSANLDALLASAVTYNQSPSGRFGQRVASRRIDARASGNPRRSRLHGIAQNNEFRTNIGMVNLTGSPRRVTLHFDGATATIDLRPWEGVQHNLITFFPAACCVEEGAVLVDAPADVVTYQSRVDQRTGDGTYSLAEIIGHSPQGSRFVRNLTVAVRSAGALGTSWKTALQIANDGGQDQPIELTFVPAIDPSLARSRSLSLPSAGLFTTDDVMSWMSVPADQTFGWLRVESDAPFTGWGRIYNDASSGTYGQFVPLEESSPAASVMLHKRAFAPSATARQLFPVSETAARRTNFGIAEVAGKPATLLLKVYDASGALLSAHERSIPPFGSQVLFDLLAPHRNAEELRVEVETSGEGDLRVYASTVENSNGDAVYIPAE